MVLTVSGTGGVDRIGNGRDTDDTDADGRPVVVVMTEGGIRSDDRLTVIEAKAGVG